MRFHGACIDPVNPLCLVTDFMSNGNLRSYLDKNPNIDFNRKTEWIKGIAAGMDHLGKEGIVHRDLGIC